MVKAKAEKSKRAVAVKPNDERSYTISIADIVSNSENPRESAPHLISLGYGIFDKLEGSDKPAVVSLGLSEKQEDKAEFVKLIDKFEIGVAELAASMFLRGQIHDAVIRQRKDGKYDLVVGCRRLLAALYNHCKTNVPARLQCKVKEVPDHDAVYMAFDENAHRLAMSPIEQAKWFAQMKNAGMKPQEISEKTKVDHQTVRSRLELLKLPQELQTKVHEGELGVVKALKLVKGRSDPSNPKNTTKGGKGGAGESGSRRGVPTLAAFRKMYEERADLHEKVREFIAVEILQQEYHTFREIQAAKAEHEKQVEKVKAGDK